jgi:hypothetical protein
MKDIIFISFLWWAGRGREGGGRKSFIGKTESFDCKR